jgi:hypothetical protein
MRKGKALIIVLKDFHNEVVSPRGRAYRKSVEQSATDLLDTLAPNPFDRLALLSCALLRTALDVDAVIKSTGKDGVN